MMKKFYGMALALLVVSMTPSCKSTEKKSDSKTSSSTEVPTTLSPNEWEGTWIVETDEKGEEPVTVYLSPDHISHYNGCNTVSAEIILGKENEIQFSHALSTQKLCPDERTNTTVAEIFSLTRSYKMVKNEFPTIQFFDRKGELIATLTKRTTDQLNGEWKVTSINNKPVTDEELPTITFDIQEMQISGFAGCNRMFGEIILDNTANGIAFGNIATTRMACPDMNTERDFVAALNQVNHFKFTNDEKTQVTLYSKEDTALIGLEKAQ